jgi:hypothetical protein
MCAPCAAPQSRPWSLHRQLDMGFKPHPGALSQARPLALCSCISSDGVSTRIDKSQLELELNLKFVELVDPEPLTSSVTPGPMYLRPLAAAWNQPEGPLGCFPKQRRRQRRAPSPAHTGPGPGPGPSSQWARGQVATGPCSGQARPGAGLLGGVVPSGCAGCTKALLSLLSLVSLLAARKREWLCWSHGVPCPLHKTIVVTSRPFSMDWRTVLTGPVPMAAGYGWHYGLVPAWFHPGYDAAAMMTLGSLGWFHALRPPAYQPCPPGLQELRHPADAHSACVRSQFDSRMPAQLERIAELLTDECDEILRSLLHGKASYKHGDAKDVLRALQEVKESLDMLTEQAELLWMWQDFIKVPPQCTIAVVASASVARVIVGAATS